ncbi:tape measure protein [Acinetobacter sp. ULE_I001]|uniref:tape measure protein n=1 Tax=unclassified Acinetobacter TaxID=196816 RepID=UPI003AF79184
MATKLGALTLDLICRTGRFTQGMRDASNSASREMGRIESSTQAVNSMLKQLATTAAATFTVSQVVNYADSYTGMVNKLKLVTTTQTELSRAMSDTHQIAQGSASDWASVVDVYTKFQKISDRLGLSQKEVARITETVTKSVGMSGASADEAQRSLVQFSQGLSLGVLRGQDLNSVMAQTPGLTDAIAKGMGVTSDKLKQMGADNVLTTELVVNALKKVADSVDEDYAKTATTVASSFNLIKNESIRMIGEFDSATGASAKFVAGMTLLSKNMDTVTNTMMIGGAYMAGTYIPVLATTTIGFIKSSAEAVRYQVALAGMQASATGASRTLVVLKGVLGGPAGLGIMAASAAAGFLLMRDSSKDTQSALEEQGLTVDELKVKYSQLNAEQLKLKALGASDAIEAENEKIRTSFVSLERYISDLNGQGNTDQARALQQYLDELRAGGDSAKNAFARLEKQKIGSPAVIEYAAKLGVTVKDSTKEIDKQNQILSIASNKHLDHAKAAKTGAEGVGKVGIEAVSAAAKVKNLGEEVQKFINDSLNSTTDNLRKYQLISQGYTTATAEMILAAEKAEGIGRDSPLGKNAALSVLSTSTLATQVLSQKKLTDLTDARSEAEKKVNEELKKRKELLEKTVSSKTIDSVIARGEGNYNSFNKGKAGDSVGSKLNLVDMTVGQIRALQKNGSIFAAGKYQNIPSTLQGAIDAGIVSVAEKFNANVQERIVQQYLLTAKKDRGSIEDYIKSKSDNLYAANLDLAKEFASVASPVTGKSYYDGKAGNKASISVKEAQNALKASRELYTQAIASGKSAEEAWKAAFSGSISFVEGSDEQKSLEKLASYKEKLAEERTALIEYYDDWQKLENKNSEAVKNIRETFAKDPKAMEDHLALQEVKYQEDVENYIKAGDDRVKADHQATQDIIDTRQAAFDNINNPLYSMRDKGVEAIAQSSLSPLAYQKWDLNRQQQDGFSQLGDDLNTGSLAISKSDILSEQEKKDKLLQIEQEYQDAKLALAQTYDQQHRDLEDQTHAASLAGYGAMFGMMGSMFDAYGDKESTGYKVAFAMQKAFVLSSAILNAKGAVMAAWNDPANTTIWQKMAAAAATVVQTNDLMSAIQGVALTGMAHDGIANVPEEGTWLLSKGERVLNPKDNKALTNMINNGGGGGDVTIQVNITDSGVNTSGGNNQNQKQLGDAIGNAVRAVIIQEKRQGGLLSK